MKKISAALAQKNIPLQEIDFMGKPSVIGYSKEFRWSWIATQLNTFVIASDYGDELITVDHIKQHLDKGFSYAKQHYSGWPRGFQSGFGVISILESSNLSPEAIEFCIQLKSGKKFAAFVIPVVKTATTTYRFQSKPLWGRIYFPYFEKLIDSITA